MRNYKTLLDAVINSHSKIIGAAVIEEQVHMKLKAGAPKFTEVDLARMATQAQHTISIGKTNERLLGELQYVVFYHRFISAMLFSLDTFHVLAVGVGNMGDIEHLAFKIRELTKGY